MIRLARLVPGAGHEAAKAMSLRLLADALLEEKGLRLGPEPLAHTREGMPFLPGHAGIHISLAHCEGLAACAVADTPVGIDAERLRPHSPFAARHAMGNEELDAIRNARDPDLEFFRRWTLKESCLKAMGTGLGYPIRELEFVCVNNMALCINKPEFQFTVWEENGYMLALCVQLPQTVIGHSES